MRPELRAILEDLSGLDAVLERAAERYVALSRIGGTVPVEPGEQRAVERLGCRLSADGRLKLTELDRAFRASRLRAPLTDVLADFRGEVLLTRDDARRREDEAWKGLLARLEELRPPDWARAWVEAEEGRLRAEWRRHGGSRTESSGSGAGGSGASAAGGPSRVPETDTSGTKTPGSEAGSWEVGLERAVRAAGALESIGESTELPRLAYRVCGDAHGLDSDGAAGRLFERALLHRHRDAGLTLPLSAEDRESLFAMAGLTVDELSSTVHVVGLRGPAPLLVAARRGRHVLALPLRTVYEIGDDIRAHRGIVFAVENRSLLSALHREMADVDPMRYPTLVCTGGHLSLAALRLLDRLHATGAVVRYSGDFDARGLMIAAALADRFGEGFQPWRMDVEAFRVALAARRTDRRVDPGAVGPGARASLPGLARAVDAGGAAYQEGLTGLLVEDLRAWIRAG